MLLWTVSKILVAHVLWYYQSDIMVILLHGWKEVLKKYWLPFVQINFMYMYSSTLFAQLHDVNGLGMKCIIIIIIEMSSYSPSQLTNLLLAFRSRRVLPYWPSQWKHNDSSTSRQRLGASRTSGSCESQRHCEWMFHIHVSLSALLIISYIPSSFHSFLHCFSADSAMIWKW